MNIRAWRQVAVVAVMIAAGSARADDRANKRLTAENLAKQARQDNDLVKAVACGQAFIDLYNADTSASDADEALYNAGVCFEEGQSFGAAINAFQSVTTMPKPTRLAAKAGMRMARLYQRVGFLPKAADALEELARKWPKEPGAPDALADAIALRVALSDDAKQIADTNQFVMQFGSKDARTPALVFGLAAVRGKESAEARETQLREFLKTYGKSDELTARAYAELGESMWRRSCGVGLVDGACIKVVRERVLPMVQKKAALAATAKRCGAATMIVEPVARDQKLVQLAIAAFAQAEKLADKLPTSSPGALRWRAMAKLDAADRDFEAYIAVRFPANLDLSPSAGNSSQATKRFTDYFAAKTKAGATATDRYTALIALKDPTASIAAIARIGQISQLLAVDIGAAEIPATLRSGKLAADMIVAYCERLDEVAEPLIKRAIDAYDMCLEQASVLGIADRWVQLCERERGNLGPTTFAITRELVPAAPLHFPVVVEDPIRASRTQPTAYRETIEKLWAAPRPIPAATCNAIAKTFTDLVKTDKRAEVWYMAGVTWGRCNQLALAKAAYTSALRLDPIYAQATSNLAELEYRAGNIEAARKLWDTAFKTNGKLFGARVGLVAINLRDLRTATTNRHAVESEIEVHAASAAALGSDAHPAPLVALAILAKERDQLPLAKYLLWKASTIGNAPYIDLALAAIGAAEGNPILPALERAAASPIKLDETPFALGVHYLALRRYDDATTQLAQVKTRSYELLVARGIAARGQGKLADAEARYREASVLDAGRPEAHFDLAVLWKDYTAARATDPAVAKAALGKAAAEFRRAGTAEATAAAIDCDKAAALL